MLEFFDQEEENEFQKVIVLVVVAELSNDWKYVVDNVSKKDDVLIDAINEYKKELADNNIEIFEQHNNILITEKGYYFSTYFDNVEMFDNDDE